MVRRCRAMARVLPDIRRLGRLLPRRVAERRLALSRRLLQTGGPPTASAATAPTKTDCARGPSNAYRVGAHRLIRAPTPGVGRMHLLARLLRDGA